jgi:secreted trypsin-like serine protease
MSGVRRGRLVAVAFGAGVLVCGGGVALGATPAKRVVGGSPADWSQWPYAAAVYEHDTLVCTGSVIARRAVLTAGHCAGPHHGRTMAVVVGRANLADHSSGKRIEVKRARVTRRYRRTGNDDFAVLRLAHRTTVPQATLPTRDEAGPAAAVGERLRFAGWGVTHANGTGRTNVLLAAETTVVRGHKCRRAYGRHWGGRAAICTVGDPLPQGGRVSACYGDSGGPLVADTPAGPLLVGVTSYGGFRCGEDPTVYARVSDALRFIRRNARL